MKKVPLHTRGFLTVELVLAAAVFSLFVVAFFGSILFGEESAVLAGKRARAALLAEEGLEAIRNIRDEDFSSLQDGTHGLEVVNGRFELSGSEDETDGFTRTAEISSLDTYRKSVSSRVVWEQGQGRAGELVLESILTDWQRSVATSTP